MLKNCDDKKTLCDAAGCAGVATCALPVKGKRKHIYFCSACRLRLFAEISRQIVPKSPRNRIAAASEERSGTIKRFDNETKKD